MPCPKRLLRVAAYPLGESHVKDFTTSGRSVSSPGDHVERTTSVEAARRAGAPSYEGRFSYMVFIVQVSK